MPEVGGWLEPLGVWRLLLLPKAPCCWVVWREGSGWGGGV